MHWLQHGEWHPELDCAVFFATRMQMSIGRLLSAAEAVAIDAKLMSEGKFTLDQLMELAGQSVAVATTQAMGGHLAPVRMLVVAGPGNNGGDAVVASRWLKQFGYTQVDLIYPKPSSKPFFQSLVRTAADSGVRVLDTVPSRDTVLASYDAILDGLFGFSFKPPVRTPYDDLLALMMSCSEWEPCSATDASIEDTCDAHSTTNDADRWWLPQQNLSQQAQAPVLWQRRRSSGIPIISVDIPSGWPADGVTEQQAESEACYGPQQTTGTSAAVALNAQGGAGGPAIVPSTLTSYLRPSMVVHLTWPKTFAAQVDPRHVQHWLGGRFMPPALAEQYGLHDLLNQAYGRSTDVAVHLQ